MSARILVVDDDVSIALMVRTVLAKSGYEVRTATSAAQALSRFELGQFDLVITDKCMPGEDGDALISTLREKFPSLPAIVMTAYPAIRPSQIAIQGYLAKPFKNLAAITVAVDRALQMVALRSGARAA